jgi:hypothetical protein
MPAGEVVSPSAEPRERNKETRRREIQEKKWVKDQEDIDYSF